MSAVLLVFAKLNSKINSALGLEYNNNNNRPTFLHISSAPLSTSPALKSTNQKTIMATNLETRPSPNAILSPSHASNNDIDTGNIMQATDEAASQIQNQSYASILAALVTSFKWKPTSEEDLELCETKLLSGESF